MHRTYLHAVSWHTCWMLRNTCSMLRNCMCSYCLYTAQMGWAWLHALSWHTCWMPPNCTCMFHAAQLHVLVLFVYWADGVGVGGWAWLHALFGTHVGCYATAHTCFTKRRSKTRLTGAQALDKLQRSVPKSLRYMWRFNNRNWWKQLGELRKQQWKKANKDRKRSFFLVGRSSQCFGGVFTHL